MNENSLQWTGVLGGTFCSIFSLLPVTDLFRTVLFSIIGTLVSYLVTLFLQSRRKKIS